MSLFHSDYRTITDKLPTSLVKRSYDRLLSLKHNPITSNQISEKHNRIETYLQHTLEIYEQGKARSRKIYPIFQPDLQTPLRDITENSLIHNETIDYGLSLENLRQELTIKIRNENALYLENKTQQLQSEHKQYINNYNKELYILKQKLEDQYTSKMQSIKSRESTLIKSIEVKDKEIAKLSSTNGLSKNNIRIIKDALKSAQLSIDKLENENRQLLYIISIKDKKIITLADKTNSYFPNKARDGSIEPEKFYSTYDQELWNKWYNDAKYNPEIREKYIFRR